MKPQLPVHSVLSALPGLLLAAAVAAAAHVLGSAPIWPLTLPNGSHPLGGSVLAILLGLLVTAVLPETPALRRGLSFCFKAVLPAGIVLMGARLVFGDLLRVGSTGVLLTLLAVATCAGVTFVLVRAFAMPAKLTTLVAVGTAICGGSAIAAVAPVIEAEEDDIAWSVTAVALLGMVAMFTLPIAGNLVGLDAEQFGIWAGLTIHQTPQVVAAGLAYGGEAGEIATLIKLVRVTMLAPVVFVVGLVYARRCRGAVRCRGARVPFFVIGFFAMAALGSLGLLPNMALGFGAQQHTVSTTALARTGADACLAISMAAIGLETRFSMLARAGLKPVVAGVVTAVTLCGVTLIALRLLGI